MHILTMQTDGVRSMEHLNSQTSPKPFHQSNLIGDHTSLASHAAAH